MTLQNYRSTTRNQSTKQQTKPHKPGTCKRKSNYNHRRNEDTSSYVNPKRKAGEKRHEKNKGKMHKEKHYISKIRKQKNKENNVIIEVSLRTRENNREYKQHICI